MNRSRENQSPDNESSDRADSESAEQESGFIGRWSRRKQSVAAESQAVDDQPLLEAADHAALPEAALAEEPAALTDSESAHAPILTDEDMPDIETLNADSDFSPFFSDGVSKELRNLALKKLFFSGKFSARDGLDDYDDDFTKFEPLGDTVTSDMKFHARRKEKARLAELEEERLRLEAANAENDDELPEADELPVAEADEGELVSEAEFIETDIASVDQSEELTESPVDKIADNTENKAAPTQEPQKV